MKKQVITYLLVGIAALPAASQEKLEGTLYVEGEYVPTVVRQDKIHLLPQKVSFELPTFRPEPATGLLTGNYVPGYNARLCGRERRRNIRGADISTGA